MCSPRFRSAIRLLLLVAVCGGQLLAVSARARRPAALRTLSLSGATVAPDTPALTLGQPVTRELKGGETHRFAVLARVGQLLRVSIEAQGIDLICALND